MRPASRTIADFLATADAPAAARAWRVALAAMLSARHLEHPVDLPRVLEMAVAQALPGRPEDFRRALPPDDAVHLHALLLELETAGTSEARLVHGLDALLDGRDPAVRQDPFVRALRGAMAGAGTVRAAG